ncbi:type II toxin-antitoxin system RelB/DinJ family antitoxin [bacterium]|nr:type II toxin-antitoxin system RelB/DinJ family antitoxin [bacterium]
MIKYMSSKNDEHIANEFIEILKKLGINPKTAFDIFMRKVVNSKGIPFDMKLDNEIDEDKINPYDYRTLPPSDHIPNEKTIKAFNEPISKMSGGSAEDFLNKFGKM